jgi:hypothetical protein
MIVPDDPKRPPAGQSWRAKRVSMVGLRALNNIERRAWPWRVVFPLVELVKHLLGHFAHFYDEMFELRSTKFIASLLLQVR